MKKKINYKNSSLVYTTGLSSTNIEEDGAVNKQFFCTIDTIRISEKDDVRKVFAKLLGTAVSQILDLGEIYVKLYLDTKNIDLFLLDDYKLVILSLGFDQVSKTDEGIMFSFGGD